MKRRSKREDVVVPVASMGDIAFQLIIFFMICSQFSQDVGIQLKPPEAPALRKLDSVQVSISIDEEGTFWLNDKEIPDAEAVEWGVRAMIKDKQGPLGRTVMFRCDRRIGKETFEPVLEAIAKGGGLVAATGENLEDQ